MQRLRLDGSRSFGDLDRLGGAALDACAREIVGRRKSEGAIGDDANANAERFRIGGAGDLAILRGERTVALIHNAGFGQRGAAQLSRFQGPGSDFFHLRSPR